MPNAFTSFCPMCSRNPTQCDFAGKIDGRGNLNIFLAAFIQEDPEQNAKHYCMVESVFSWCKLQWAAKEIHSALVYGVSWNRFKTLNQPHWIETTIAAKCLFGIDELTLEQIFILREKIVDKKLLEAP